MNRSLLRSLSWLAAPALYIACGIALAQDVTPVIHVPNAPNTESQQRRHYVVLVSLDGFRYDYAGKFGAPNLEAMAAAGASTPEGMRPSYPSVTFPNHYTLVTGLRPEHHGMVGMEFYDAARDQTFLYSNSEKSADGYWWRGGLPIWSLAEQQGMRSACMFWPGSEAEIGGKRPSYYLHYDDKVDDAKRIEQVIAWLKLPAAERPHIITLYYANVDTAGHNFGPDAPETRNAVQHVDALMGDLRAQLKELGLPVDLIVTADHGMVKYEGDPVVLDRFADLSAFKTAGAFLYAPDEQAAEKAFEQFRAHPDPRFTAYRRKDVPQHLHFNENPLEGDPVIVANGPYAIYAHAPKKAGHPGGHGFDPEKLPEMKAIFYVEGPDIRPGRKLASFDNVDVLPFVVRLLDLPTPKTDGALKPLRKALR